MFEIGVRELRNNVAAVLRRAAAGERIIVTVDGQPTAQLGPLSPDEGGLTMADLVAAGLVVQPDRSDPPTDRELEPLPVDVRVDAIVAEIRGTR